MVTAVYMVGNIGGQVDGQQSIHGQDEAAAMG
jgi:hypothetical protein